MFQLSDPGQRTLLGIAREAVRAHLSANTPELPHIESGELSELRALFVSIHAGDALRGCVGNLHPTFPLYRSTADCAISAAVADPRFSPVMPDELPHLSFEISVLSPVETVRNPSEIEIGVHGLLVTNGRARGLLLPQVATQYAWDRERFLAETCRKAGLHDDAWKNGAGVYRFSALVFGEQHIHHPLHS